MTIFCSLPTFAIRGGGGENGGLGGNNSSMAMLDFKDLFKDQCKDKFLLSKLEEARPSSLLKGLEKSQDTVKAFYLTD